MVDEDPDLLKKVITGDESRLYGHAIGTKTQSIEASRRAKTERSTSSSEKCGAFTHCFPRLQWHGAS